MNNLLEDPLSRCFQVILLTLLILCTLDYGIELADKGINSGMPREGITTRGHIIYYTPDHWEYAMKKGRVMMKEEDEG